MMTDSEDPTIEDVLQKPTVKRLTTPKGVQVYIVGTGHFSEKSCQDVADVIRAVRPDTIVLELCPSRLSVLTLDENAYSSFSSTSSLATLRSELAKGGLAGLAHALLASLSAKLSKDLKFVPGKEFRTAVAEAKQLPFACKLVLGDRPIDITLGRVMAALSVWEKITLCYNIVTGIPSMTLDEVEKYKEKDLLTSAIRELAQTQPKLAHILLDERDQFLAYMLRAAGTQSVVGVVGIGHMEGIEAYWNDTTIDLKQLMQVPVRPASVLRKVVRVGLLAGSVCAVGYIIKRRLF